MCEFSSPVTKGRLDVLGINASKSLSKYWLNALTPAEAKKVDIATRNKSRTSRLLFGTTKTPEMAHNIIVRLILTLKRFTNNLNILNIEGSLDFYQNIRCLKEIFNGSTILRHCVS
jgi:hypothetical protein